MKSVYYFVIFALSILSFQHTLYAAFPLKYEGIPTMATSHAPQISDPAAITPPDTKKHKHHHHYGHEEPSDRYDLSIVSFVLSLGSILALAFAVGTLAAPLAGVGIVLAVVAFIVGAQALNKKQKLKGLAILGLIIGGVITIRFIATIIPVLING